MRSLYEPGEDTELLITQVEKLAYGDVLDMGTGTGMLVKAALKNKNVKSVTGADINPYAVEYCKKTIKGAKFVQSDLFENIKGKFDVITFNPPYLPEEKKEDLETALMTSGGYKGYELLIKFLKQAKEHLKKDGFILTVFSTLTGPEEVFKEAKELGYDAEILDSKKLFFEKLYCVKFKLAH